MSRWFRCESHGHFVWIGASGALGHGRCPGCLTEAAGALGRLSGVDGVPALVADLLDRVPSAEDGRA